MTAQMIDHSVRTVGDWRDWMVPPLLVPTFLAAAALAYGLMRS
jgi:hypothetical protein